MAFKDHTIDISENMRDDQDFKTGVWYELRKKCPNFFKIIEYQYPSEPVPIDANYNGYKTAELDIRLVLAFIGRLFVSIGLLEKWQKAIAIIGTSGVGKTKLMEFVSDFFGFDVFNLKNNPEEMFGFETAIGKRLCIVEELSTRSKIPGDMMLSMICGAKRLPVSRKNKTQHDMEFKMPMFAIGNSFPFNWPNERGQSERRFFVSYWDRPLPPGGCDQKLPDRMDDERAYALMLCMRAYHSLVRTLGESHVEDMIPPDIKRDCSEVVAGTDDTTAFIRNSGLIRFDKRGIRSEKWIPVDVLMNEWAHFKSEKYGKKESKKMTKREFFSILEVTGAVPLIDEEKDKDTGPPSTFGIPKYAHPWPWITNAEYHLTSKRQISSSCRSLRAFVVGIELNMPDCPRFTSIGDTTGQEEDNSSYSYSSSSSFSSSSSGCESINSDDLTARLNQYNRGVDVLTNQEKNTLKSMKSVIHRSISYQAVNNGGRVKVHTKTYMANFNTIRNGNTASEDDNLTKWELSVMERYDSLFRVLEEKGDGVTRVVLQDEVTTAAAKKYVTHDLRTVKLRLQLRSIDCSRIVQLYNAASAYFV
jgi:hypothetical protein